MRPSGVDMFASKSNEVESRYLPEKVTSLEKVCKNLLCRKYDTKKSTQVDLLRYLTTCEMIMQQSIIYQ